MSGTPCQPQPPVEASNLTITLLDPREISFERMPYGGLRLKTARGEVYDRVRVYRTFPLSMPDEYIALRVGDSELEQKEIGLIRRLKDLNREDRSLVEHELVKRYFIHAVKRIVSIREEMGHFYWVVDTDKGRREFPVPIRTKYITYIGTRGRLITDVDGNRYEISDLDALDPASRGVFNRHIYW